MCRGLHFQLSVYFGGTHSSDSSRACRLFNHLLGEVKCSHFPSASAAEMDGRSVHSLTLQKPEREPCIFEGADDASVIFLTRLLIPSFSAS